MREVCCDFKSGDEWACFVIWERYVVISKVETSEPVLSYERGMLWFQKWRPVSLLEPRRNEEILEEARVEAIAMAMRRTLEWFRHVKRRKHQSSCGKEDWELWKWRLRRTALEEDRSCEGKILSEGAWTPGTSWGNGPLTGNDGKVSSRPVIPHREKAAKGEKDEWK